MRKIILSLMIILLMVSSVLAISPIGSIFSDTITNDLGNSRSESILAPRYDGTKNNFELQIVDIPTTYEAGDIGYATINVKNNGASGWMYVECGLLDESKNSWIANYVESRELGTSSVIESDNCHPAETFTQTKHVYLSQGSGKNIDFIFEVPAVENPANNQYLYCSAFEQCYDAGDDMYSDRFYKNVKVDNVGIPPPKRDHLTCYYNNMYWVKTDGSREDQPAEYCGEVGCVTGADTCNTNAAKCSDNKFVSDCLDVGCYWDSADRNQVYKCKDSGVYTAIQCDKLGDSSTNCNNLYGCKWDNNKCSLTSIIPMPLTPPPTPPTDNTVIYPVDILLNKDTVYNQDTPVDFSVKVATNSTTDQTAFVEVGIYCGDLAEYLDIDSYVDSSKSSRAYNVESMNEPCVAEEQSFVNRKKVTMKKSDGVKSITGFNLKVPNLNTYGGPGNTISNSPNIANKVCYIVVDTFDYCWDSTPSTSSVYTTYDTYKVAAFPTGGTSIDLDEVVCCDMDIAVDDVVDNLKQTADGAKLVGAAYSFSESVKQVTDYLLSLFPALKYSLSKSAEGVEIPDNKRTYFKTIRSTCEDAGFQVADKSLSSCLDNMDIIADQWMTNAREVLEEEKECVTDADCSDNDILTKCGNDGNCTTWLECPYGSLGTCTQDRTCADRVTVSYKCEVFGDHKCLNPEPENLCSDLTTKAIINPNNEDQFCIFSEDGESWDACFYRKELTEISELNNIFADKMDFWESKRILQNYLVVPENPLCLKELGDVQCVDGGQCLQALNSESPYRKNNKAVYDAYDEFFMADFNWFWKMSFAIGDIVTNNAVEKSREDQIKLLGVCTYKETGAFEKFKRTMGAIFGLDPDDQMILYITVGGAVGLLFLMSFLTRRV